MNDRLSTEFTKRESTTPIATNSKRADFSKASSLWFSNRLQQLDGAAIETLIQLWRYYRDLPNRLSTAYANYHQEIIDIKRIVEDLYLQNTHADYAVVRYMVLIHRNSLKIEEGILFDNFYSLFSTLHASRTLITLMRHRLRYVSLPTVYNLFLHTIAPLATLQRSDEHSLDRCDAEWDAIFELAQYSRFKVHTLLLLLDIEIPPHHVETRYFLQSVEYLLREIEIACRYNHILHLNDCRAQLKNAINQHTSNRLANAC